MIIKNLTYLERVCSDYKNIENYEIAVNSEKKYHLHHKLEIQGDKVLSRQTLKEMDLYFHRPSNELIFLTETEHRKLHGKYITDEQRKLLSLNNLGHPVSEETKQKISQANKGKSAYNKGIPMDEKTKLKLSIAKTGTKQNISDEERKRRSDLIKEYMATHPRDLSGKNNPHYGITVSNEQKIRQSQKMKGRHWYNNGEISISAFECPSGFIPGRLNSSSGVVGVYFDKTRNKWVARITIDNKDIRLGRFNTFIDAARARLKAEFMNDNENALQYSLLSTYFSLEEINELKLLNNNTPET